MPASQDRSRAGRLGVRAAWSQVADAVGVLVRELAAVVRPDGREGPGPAAPKDAFGRNRSGPPQAWLDYVAARDPVWLTAGPADDGDPPGAESGEAPEPGSPADGRVTPDPHAPTAAADPGPPPSGPAAVRRPRPTPPRPPATGAGDLPAPDGPAAPARLLRRLLPAVTRTEPVTPAPPPAPPATPAASADNPTSATAATEATDRPATAAAPPRARLLRPPVASRARSDAHAPGATGASTTEWGRQPDRGVTARVDHEPAARRRTPVAGVAPPTAPAESQSPTRRPLAPATTPPAPVRAEAPRARTTRSSDAVPERRFAVPARRDDQRWDLPADARWPSLPDPPQEPDAAGTGATSTVPRVWRLLEQDRDDALIRAQRRR